MGEGNILSIVNIFWGPIGRSPCMHNSVDPYGYELFSFFHKGAELLVIDTRDPLQDGASDEGEYGESNQIGYKMKGVDGGDLSLATGFLELAEHMRPKGTYFFIDLLGDLGRIASYLIDDKYRKVGMIIKKVDIGGDDALDLFLHSAGIVEEMDGNASDELAEVVDHDDVEQFLLTPEIVVEEGEVDACLFGDVAGAGGCEAILGKEFFGRLHDLFFGGEIIGGGGILPGRFGGGFGGAAFFGGTCLTLQ